MLLAKTSIVLGGQIRALRYEMNALPELEGVLKLTLAEIGVRFKKGKVGTREVRALVWAGLLHADEDLSLRQVGDWLTEADFLKDSATRDKIMERVFEALAESFPDAAKETKDAEAVDPN